MRQRKIDIDKPINPFLTSSFIPIYRKNSEVKSLDMDNIPTSDEIVLNPTTYGFTKSYYIDAQKSYKTYVGNLEDLKKLGRVALLLYAYIPEKLAWNQDLIAISTDTLSKEFEVSTVTITSAINELIDTKFITRYKKGYYWINPFRFFYGDRLKKYKDNLTLIGE